MKRHLLVIMTLLLVMSLFGCGSKEKEEVGYQEGLIFKITSTPIGLIEKYKEYTLNIEIYDDGKAIVYGTDFDTWYGDSKVPTYETEVKLHEIEEIKQLISDKGLVCFPENIGNKDGIAGDEKYLYIYTDKGTIKTGGVSPSNKRFLSVYDAIYKMVIEEVFTYTGQLEMNQKQAIASMMEVGIKICDSSDELVYDETDVKAFSISTVIENPEYSTNTDVLFENQVNEEGKEQLYNIIIELNKNATSRLDVESVNCDKHPKNYNLYIDGVYQGLIIVDQYIMDGRIRLNMNMTEEDARNIMEDWSLRIKPNDQEDQQEEQADQIEEQQETK